MTEKSALSSWYGTTSNAPAPPKTPLAFGELLQDRIRWRYTATHAFLWSSVQGACPSRSARKCYSNSYRYDVGRLAPSLDRLRVPVMAIQSTFSNERRERRSMTRGQTTPYLDMLRARVQSVRIEIIEDTGHFPQIDEPDRTNALIDDFLANLLARGSGIAV